MAEAARLAAEGAPHGTVVGADEQTAGQGRMGRRWHSEAGSGLYVSIVLRPKDAGALTLALGLAVRDAIQAAAGVTCDLRWPNDVLIDEKKCAGILVNFESGAHIAGIGINVNHASFPPELAELATSLRIATGRAHSRELLLAALLEAVDRWLERSREDVLDAFARASSYVRGRRVVVEQGGVAIHGVTDGLDPDGHLLVLRPDGSRAAVLAGGVRPAA
jgi:BirA family biotin operon repressor/biotin-[acetyl-CoA-carboxylase] ligase